MLLSSSECCVSSFHVQVTTLWLGDWYHVSSHSSEGSIPQAPRTSRTARDRTLAHRLNFYLRSFCHTTVTIATMSNLQAAKKLVEQLRVESDVQRLPVSRTIQEMIQFIEQHKEHDPLIVGIDKKTNPFHERSSCTILWTCSGLKHIHVIIAACRLDYKLKSLLISERV